MTNKIRRASQALALQGLYSMASRYQEDRESLQVSITNIIAHGKAEIDKIDEEYVRNIMTGVVKSQDELASFIQPLLAPGWTLERIGKVVQIILLMATHEILYSDIKNSTIINDYLELAKSFNHKGEVGFINSVLDKVAKSPTPENSGLE